ncbi:glycosyltransferase family 2 protein [Synechococcus sp. RS9916]|uniref:glycosyltransferase n=1 Tax=Synechococcus sp. RS9916 TaxID=221359 RepID=UPI0000E53D1B|nr:glycosyltransferase family 2 protein [Synechococcus sp. RS9916]EAU73042.1 putative glycosyltransferase family 2 [Synechococcus sp. RS9916]
MLLLVLTALLLGAGAAALGLTILLIGLQRVFAVAPVLSNASTIAPSPPTASLTVVIPAYNEAANISRCLSSVLRNETPCADWRVVVVDDDSSDATVNLASATIETTPSQAQTSVLQAGPRPSGERWVGKNWACSRAMASVETDWVLFMDADVELAPQTLRRALAQANAEEADLFSLAPRLVCSCLAEWMVQPIMASLLGLGFPMEETNNPDSPVAFAAGPFMLFRREAYTAIGGHQALADEVVEDLALARRIKGGGYRLRYCLGLDAVDLQMYANLGALWEGWSKNWFLGLDRSVTKALGAGGVVLLMFSGPWLITASAAITLLWLINNSHTPTQTIGLASAAALLGGIGIGLQLVLRLWIRQRFAVPLTHWWLMGLGGLIVAAIAPTSVWRSLTGRGWTWKGRPLA